MEIVAPPLDLPPAGLNIEDGSVRSGILWVGRVIEPYKKLGLLVSAMQELPDEKLTVIGDGRDLESIRGDAPANVEFKGWVSRDALADLYASHRLLVFPSEDDFGITVVEAQSQGTPVVAFRGGGALDTVEEGFSGTFFDEHNTLSVIEGIRRALDMDWDYAAIRDAARDRYSAGGFRDRLAEIVAQVDG
nr:glycosyltransferase [Gordonia sp. HS-NH1]